MTSISMADAMQAWLRGDTGPEATAAGCEFASAVASVVEFVDAHRTKG